jgi:hypothetical protein
LTNWYIHKLQYSIYNSIYNMVQCGSINFFVCVFGITTNTNMLWCIICSNSLCDQCAEMFKFSLSFCNDETLVLSLFWELINMPCKCFNLILLLFEMSPPTCNHSRCKTRLFQSREDFVACKDWQLCSSCTWNNGSRMNVGFELQTP